AAAEAALKPKIISDFFKKYNKGKFPTDRIAANVLETMGVPKDRAQSVLAMIKEIGEETGIVHQTKTGPYVAVDTPTPSQSATNSKHESSDFDDKPSEGNKEMESFAKSISGNPPSAE